MSAAASTEIPEARSSLASLAAAPIVWAVHFLLSYATAAIWCAKLAGPDRSLDGGKLVLGGYTLAALAVLGAIAWRALRRYRESAEPPHRDAQGSRHRFIAFSSLLVTGLGVIAIIYETLATVIAGSCR